MGKATAEVVARTSLAEAWGALADPRRLPEWVDGFGKLVSADGEWPAAGAVVVWESRPRGRGSVREEVLNVEDRRMLEVAFTDEAASGAVVTRLAIEGDGVRIDQAMTYRLGRPGPFGVLADMLFVRGEQRRSLERSLGNLRALLER